VDEIQDTKGLRALRAGVGAFVFSTGLWIGNSVPQNLNIPMFAIFAVTGLFTVVIAYTIIRKRNTT